MEPTRNIPLSCEWVERTLTIAVDERPVIGTARANWGAVEVTITSPIAHLTRTRDHRGWSFAMLAHNRLQERYACEGAFTAKGLHTAEQMLADIYRDRVALWQVGGAADELCRRARQELAEADAEFAVQTESIRREHLALRRAFKEGELTQQEHQARRKALRELEARLTHDRWMAQRGIEERFADGLKERCGRAVPLEEAERMLSGTDPSLSPNS